MAIVVALVSRCPHFFSERKANNLMTILAPPLFSVTKHKDVDMSVVTVLYGKRANSPDLIDDEGSTDGGDTSDDGDDDSYEPGSTPPVHRLRGQW